MKKDNKIYFWACDYCDISGEGILAKLFIKEHLKKKPTSVFVNVAKNNKFQKRDNFIKNKNRFNGIYHKYFFPYLGLLNLWIYFFNSKKTWAALFPKPTAPTFIFKTYKKISDYHKIND